MAKQTLNNGDTNLSFRTKANENFTEVYDGKVAGPASATDNAVVRYDSTTGKVVQNSTVVITDAGFVGVGDSAPDREIVISGATGSPAIAVRHTARTVSSVPHGVSISASNSRSSIFNTDSVPLRLGVNSTTAINIDGDNQVTFPEGVDLGTPVSGSLVNCTGASVTVRDIDGTPSISARTIEFTNGTVSDQGSGVARVTIAGGGGGGDAFTANPLSQFASTTSAQLAGVISDETGSGALVFANSPTLTTPALGTPASGTLTNCTGLPTAGLVDDAVTFAKMQNISAASRLMGRGSASGAGDPQEITLGSGLSMTGTVLSSSGSSLTVRDIDGSPSLTATTLEFTNGTVSDQGSGVARVTIAGGNETHTGDATGATVLTIAADAVTYAKMQNISAASRLLGRGSASGSGDPQEISVGSGLTMSGTTLSASAAGLAEPLVMPSTAMAALEIDVTKFVNTKSISADSTMTFSNATPTAGTRTEVKVTADSTARTLTIPSSYSFARNALITTVLIPANATISLAFEYTGARWEVYGDPVGSITRSVQLTAFDYGADVATGDGAAYFVVPTALNGMSLVSCSAYVITAGTTGTTNVQIARIRSGTPVDMLSTVLSIDSTETGTDTAATAAVINASNDDVATHDRIRIDVDAVSTTAPRGLIVVLNFEVL
jgi:hypothetical protein